MRKFFYRGRFIFIPLIAAAFLTLISYIIMQLWNGILPDVLHVSTITFWQAMGIFLLCKILFGFGGRGSRFGGAPWMRGRMSERFRNMDPEERAKFQEQFSERMCHNRSRWGWQDQKASESQKSSETQSE